MQLAVYKAFGRDAVGAPAPTASLKGPGEAMETLLSVRRVPWTCKWGRFGGPVELDEHADRGFLFWVCGHPDVKSRKILTRESCEHCPWWEPGDEFRHEGARADHRPQANGRQALSNGA